MLIGIIKIENNIMKANISNIDWKLINPFDKTRQPVVLFAYAQNIKKTDQ